MHLFLEVQLYCSAKFYLWTWYDGILLQYSVYTLSLYISGYKTLQICFPIHRNSISTFWMSKSQLMGISYSLQLLLQLTVAQAQSMMTLAH